MRRFVESLVLCSLFWVARSHLCEFRAMFDRMGFDFASFSRSARIAGGPPLSQASSAFLAITRLAKANST